MTTIETTHSLLTRASLLFRLRDWKDAASWEEFYRLYRKLIYGLARRAGLMHDEAEEVTQDVFKRVAETIQTFESDPARGSFRGWLMNLTRWRIADKFRHRPPAGSQIPYRGSNSDCSGAPECLPDLQVQETWELEWQRNMLDVALARLARRVPAKHFQVFDLYARQQWPVMQVARELGINPASIYLISHRLTKQLKSEITYLQTQLG
jgi:RNA polymerase sigma factor (sigma-70 family)